MLWTLGSSLRLNSTPDFIYRLVYWVSRAEIGIGGASLLRLWNERHSRSRQFLANPIYVQATEPNAIRFARTKWRPFICSAPRFAELLDARQSKEGGNSTLYQERKDRRQQPGLLVDDYG